MRFSKFDYGVLFTVCDLQVMKDLKLLPAAVEDVENKVNAFRNYSDEVSSIYYYNLTVSMFSSPVL